MEHEKFTPEELTSIIMDFILHPPTILVLDPPHSQYTVETILPDDHQLYSYTPDELEDEEQQQHTANYNRKRRRRSRGQIASARFDTFLAGIEQEADSQIQSEVQQIENEHFDDYKGDKHD
jgi:hypothetical protein